MTKLLLARQLRAKASELIAMAEELEREVEQLPLAAQPEVLSLDAFAKAIDRCTETARQECKAGKVPGAWQTKEGGHWKIPRAALEAYVAGKQAPRVQLVAGASRRDPPRFAHQLRSER